MSSNRLQNLLNSSDFSEETYKDFLTDKPATSLHDYDQRPPLMVAFLMLRKGKNARIKEFVKHYLKNYPQGALLYNHNQDKENYYYGLSLATMLAALKQIPLFKMVAKLLPPELCIQFCELPNQGGMFDGWTPLNFALSNNSRELIDFIQSKILETGKRKWRSTDDNPRPAKQARVTAAPAGAGSSSFMMFQHSAVVGQESKDCALSLLSLSASALISSSVGEQLAPVQQQPVAFFSGSGTTQVLVQENTPDAKPGGYKIS